MKLFKTNNRDTVSYTVACNSVFSYQMLCLRNVIRILLLNIVHVTIFSVNVCNLCYSNCRPCFLFVAFMIYFFLSLNDVEQNCILRVG